MQMPGYGPDEGGLPSIENLISTGPDRDRREVVLDTLQQMGEAAAGYAEHRRMQYRGGYPDVSDLRGYLGLE